jgi:hypothetical protein
MRPEHWQMPNVPKPTSERISGGDELVSEQHEPTIRSAWGSE